MEFKKRLQHLRKSKQISRKTLSELCGLSSDAIGKYERGECEPTLRSLFAISEFFGVTVDYLIGKSNK